MVALPSLLGFLLPLPAARPASQPDDYKGLKRRRAISHLALSRHILNDIGMDGYESPADDPRWAMRPDLER